MGNADLDMLPFRIEELKLVPELRRLAMAAAGNPNMSTIMACIAGGVAYGRRLHFSEGADSNVRS